jgi:hypothetical protein
MMSGIMQIDRETQSAFEYEGNSFTSALRGHWPGLEFLRHELDCLAAICLQSLRVTNDALLQWQPIAFPASLLCQTIPESQHAQSFVSVLRKANPTPVRIDNPADQGQVLFPSWHACLIILSRMHVDFFFLLLSHVLDLRKQKCALSNFIPFECFTIDHLRFL